jgi:hypothetical protein
MHHEVRGQAGAFNHARLPGRLLGRLGAKRDLERYR